MSWYAFDAVDDALDATRRFLFPFDFRRWLMLAVVVLFVRGLPTGGLGNLSSSLPGGGPPGEGPTGGPADVPSAPAIRQQELQLLGAAIVALVVLTVLFAVVSAVMRFVFIDAYRTDEVRVRGPFLDRFWQGIRVLLFQLFLTLLVLLPPAAAAWFLFAGAVDPGTVFGLGLPALLGIALAAVVAFLVVSLVRSFTTQFVVPVMVVTDGKVLPSWRRFWPTLRGNPLQFLLYVVVRWVLGLGVQLGAGLVIGVLGLLVGVAGAAVGYGVVLAVGGPDAVLGSVAGLAALAFVGLITLLALLAVALPVQVLAHAFLTGYELSVLGRATPEFALLPETGDGGGREVRSAAGEGDRSAGGSRSEREGDGGENADDGFVFPAEGRTDEDRPDGGR